MLTKITMKVIPEPKKGTAPVMIQDDKNKTFPFISGSGRYDYICGAPKCHQVILQKVDKGQVNDMVFKCPSCNSFNSL